jgi:hypothetical protein
VRLEGLGQVKNPMTSGIEPDLPACSIVPRPTPLRVPRLVFQMGNLSLN